MCAQGDAGAAEAARRLPKGKEAKFEDFFSVRSFARRRVPAVAAGWFPSRPRKKKTGSAIARQKATTDPASVSLVEKLSASY